MPQVRKPEVDRRIRDAGLRCFATTGYPGTSMATIAAEAGVAPANLYRYFPDGKRQLFDAVVPLAVADQHDRLVAERVAALPLGEHPRAADAGAAEELLAFWVAHRLEVVVLLARADGTPYEHYPARFERHLLDLGVRRLRAVGAEPDEEERALLEIVFANTREAVAGILLRFAEPDEIRRAIQGFWSYQLPGLDGLFRWLTGQAGRPAT